MGSGIFGFGDHRLQIEEEVVEVVEVVDVVVPVEVVEVVVRPESK